ncbi:MAG: M16 family metallopeptidase [Bryobacteraceae bacterium]
MRNAVLGIMLASAAFGQTRVVELPGKSPVITFRIVFRAGAASDPAGKPGVAALTAAMLAEGGTRDLTYKQIVEAMFPMAASVSAQVDKEMTTFSGATHQDNLEAYYKLLRSMLLEPGWREDDLKRLKDNTVNYLKVSLRGNNDEELGKELLYNLIYEGTNYGRHNLGTISSIQNITLEDVKAYYRRHYTQPNLILGVAGGYSPAFLARVKKDFKQLPASAAAAGPAPRPKPLTASRITIVDKDTRSVAYSLGFPIAVKRGDPDYPALLVAMSYLGPHRSSGGRLYQRMRQLRGLNYGDYAYIEYFPRGMYQFEPSPNLARRSQIFQIWIRPVEPATAKFALRLALYELDRFVKQGLTQEEFDRTRSYLSKYVNLLTKSKRAELGYAIDSAYYGIPDYNSYIKKSLAKLTRDDVNRAIRKHLRADRLEIVAVSRNGEAFKRDLLDPAPSPMQYNSPKPPDILEEDKIVQQWPIGVKDIRVMPLERVFE